MTTLIHDHKKKSDEDPEKLNIIYIVDSPGGSVTSILKFVDFINVAKKKYPFVEFTSIVTGLTASAGTIMAIVADKRFMTKNAHAMVHELSSGNQGKYTEFRSYVKFLDQLHDKLVTIYCDKTKKSKNNFFGRFSKLFLFSFLEFGTFFLRFEEFDFFENCSR
jgi:ATP-dependent protease ClpP protease subunit